MRGIIIVARTQCEFGGACVSVSKNSFYNTIQNCIKSLVRAPKQEKQVFIVGKKYVPVTLLLFCTLAVSVLYAQEQLAADRYVIDTVHIYPGKVKADGWRYVSQLASLDLDEYSLLHEFSALNSVSLGTESKSEYDLNLNLSFEENDTGSGAQTEQNISDQEFEVRTLPETIDTNDLETPGPVIT